MVTLDQDFRQVRGDALRIPCAITLDDGRTLDGTEQWTWAVRKRKHLPELIRKTQGSGIDVDPTTYQPTINIDPQDMPVTLFPQRERPRHYWHELEMVKAGSPETVFQGRMTVVSDVAQ